MGADGQFAVLFGQKTAALKRAGKKAREVWVESQSSIKANPE
jgi:hypothetical protein